MGTKQAQVFQGVNKLAVGSGKQRSVAKQHIGIAPTPFDGPGRLTAVLVTIPRRRQWIRKPREFARHLGRPRRWIWLSPARDFFGWRGFVLHAEPFLFLLPILFWNFVAHSNSISDPCVVFELHCSMEGAGASLPLSSGAVLPVQTAGDGIG